MIHSLVTPDELLCFTLDGITIMSLSSYFSERKTELERGLNILNLSEFTDLSGVKIIDEFLNMFWSFSGH